MPAVSKKQQQFMALVHQVQKGEIDADSVSPAVRKAALNMSAKQTKEYAETKVKGLPLKKEADLILKAEHVYNKLVKEAGFPKKVRNWEVIREMGIGFLAGGTASNVGTAITYPIDTRNVRAQTGQPMPKGIKEHYAGIGPKALKTTLGFGLTIGLTAPLERLIKRKLGIK